MEILIAAFIVGLGLASKRGRQMLSGALMYQAVRTLIRRFAK